MTNSYTGDTSPYTSPPGREAAEELPYQRPLLLTVTQAAAMIGIGRTTLYRLMDTGEITSVHVRSSRRVPLQSVHEFVERLSRHTIDDSAKRP
jgi:excisionase family DNA binding protein